MVRFLTPAAVSREGHHDTNPKEKTAIINNG
jgi:hypothetical protein